jgi:hypothetical protein
MIDVTRDYVPVSDIEVELQFGREGERYVYLAVFNNAGWTALAIAPVSNGKALFQNMGRGIVYLPLYYTPGKFELAGQPFLIGEDGIRRDFTPGVQTEVVTLTRKFPMEAKKTNWLESLAGGKFEGANRSDFSDAIVLGTIKQRPGEHWEELATHSKAGYKYFRFVFSPAERTIRYWGDGASIAEVECINPKGIKLIGKPFGSEGKKYSPYSPELCFDGKELTFFEDARANATHKYVGLEFPTPQQIHKIRYIARNDQNSIQKDDTYELLFWNGNGFASLGKQVAKGSELVYKGVPQNALLWLRNLSGGKEERIFTWENNRQVWH